MKRNRTIAIIFYLASVAFYILALINIFGESTRTMGIILLCLGSMWLCLGSAYIRKPEAEDNDSDGEDE